MYNKCLLYVLFLLLACTACKKEYSVETAPEIITIGGITESNIQRAIYWTNAEYHYVEEPTNNIATHISAMEKWNGNIFIIGEYNEGNGWKPCFWVRGKRYAFSFQLPPFIPSNFYYIQDVKIYNNILYIIPNRPVAATNIPVFLIKIKDINKSPEIILLKLPSNAKISDYVSVINMSVTKDKLMVFGNYRTNISTTQPCIWEVDSLNRVNTITPEKNIAKNFLVVAGSATDTKNYMIGIGPQLNDSTYIWTKEGRFMTLQQSISTNRIENDIQCKIDNNGDLYIVSSGFKFIPSFSSKAQIWKITPTKEFSEISVSIPTNHNSYTFGLDILNNDYAFGIYHIDTISDNILPRNPFKKYAGLIQFNNQQIALNIPPNAQTSFMDKIRITKKLKIYN